MHKRGTDRAYPHLPDYSWEFIRSSYEWLRPQPKALLDQGDIACCQASVELIFFECLNRLGYPIYQKPPEDDPAPQPYRFCIINKHIEGDRFEVFVMTTFGGAKSPQGLSAIAKHFGVPMGQTYWEGNIPGIQTTPPLFGAEKTSFAFALPAVRSVQLANLRTQVTLVPGELARLNEFSKSKFRDFDQHQARLQAGLRDFKKAFKKKSDLPTDLDDHDEFRPTPKSAQDVETQSQDAEDDEPLVELSSNYGPVPYRKIQMPKRLPFPWLLRLSPSNAAARAILCQLPSSWSSSVNSTDLLIQYVYIMPLQISSPCHL